jgi:hypothetical protein
MVLGVRLKMPLEDSPERAFHCAYNARSSVACTPPAQPGSCNVKSSECVPYIMAADALTIN